MKNKNHILLASAIFLAALTSLHAQTNFTKITAGAIVNDRGFFIGAVWADFDNDGFLDLIVASYNNLTNAYYRNNGDGTFTRITLGDPVVDSDYHTFPAAGDYDNDGSLDLVVSAGVGAPSARHNLLYHNNGDGSFHRVSGGSLTNLTGYFGECAWVDYDNDGFLDLFVTDTGPTDTGAKNVLWHNSGDGTFTRILTGPLVTDLSFWTGAAWADYDNDGFMDVLVVNSSNGGANRLYHNGRNGVFTPVLTNVVATDLWPAGALTPAWGDYDNDGFQDLFVTSNGGTTNRLYRNNGNGTFSRITSGPMLRPPPGSLPNGAGWGDYDNDGYLDLFVSSINGRNALYHNNGDGTFTEILSGSPVNDGAPGIYCNTVAWIDYDNDGFLDLFVSQNNGPGLGLANLLYHNNRNTNAWLEVKLVGTASNRSAYGAKVRARATIGGKTFWQMRELHSGAIYNTVPLVAHFGLGDATNVETVRIEWPSGTVQEFQNVGAKQILTITEPPRLLASMTNGVPKFSLKGGRGFQYEVDSSPDLSAWSSIGVLTITNLNGTIQIVDTNPPALDQRFYRAVSR